MRGGNRALIAVAIGMSGAVNYFVQNADRELLGIVIDLEDVGLPQLANPLDLLGIKFGMESDIGK